MSPQSENQADLRLRRRILDGEEGAADDFVARHLGPLYSFAHYRTGGNRELTEDVVQDTFLVALERLHTYDGRASLAGWLSGIARNKLRGRRRKRRPTPLADVLDESEGEIDSILSGIAREPLPESVLEREETRDLVGATLSSLPTDYQEALVQKYCDGQSVAEIAEAIGRGEKATESLLTRARTAFARVFELLAERRGGIA